MSKEIERKFLVNDDSFRSLATSSHTIIQGYISTDPKKTVRVRIKDDIAYITIKGLTTGISRSEWEYEIPVEQARQMLDELCVGNMISKTRYIVPIDGHTWEIDEFHGRLDGLILAEIELTNDTQNIYPLPPFIGREVSTDPKYYNSTLSQAPSHIK